MENNIRTPSYNEITPYEQGFNSYYQKEILPEQQRLETIRLRYFKYFKINIFISIIIAIIVCFWNVSHWGYVQNIWRQEDGFESWLWTIVFILGGLSFLIFLPMQKYSKKIKSDIFCKIANFFASFTYDPEGMINELYISDSNILPTHHTNKGEDLIQGNVNGVGVQLSENKLINGRGRNRKTVFKGLFVLFELEGDREYKSRVVGKKDLGKFGNLFNHKWGMKRVSLEDPDLEKAFEFFADDQVEARVILDPAFMDRINKFYQFMKRTHNIKNIQFSFYDKKLFIMMASNKNFFENYKVWETCINTVYVRKFLGEMHMIIKIAELLKMERKARR